MPHLIAPEHLTVELLVEPTVLAEPSRPPWRSLALRRRLSGAVFSSEEALRKRLLDPAFWRPRLASLSEIPRQLTLIVRPDLAQPGIDVLELRLVAHDGVALRAFLARSAFHSRAASVRIRPCTDLVTCALDWRAVEEGFTDVVLPRIPERRMEDRVLDVLRLVDALASLEKVPESSVQLCGGLGSLPDEFVLAELVRASGWHSS